MVEQTSPWGAHLFSHVFLHLPLPPHPMTSVRKHSIYRTNILFSTTLGTLISLLTFPNIPPVCIFHAWPDMVSARRQPCCMKKNLKKEKTKYLHTLQLTCSNPVHSGVIGREGRNMLQSDLKVVEQQLKVETCDPVTFWWQRGASQWEEAVKESGSLICTSKHFPSICWPGWSLCWCLSRSLALWVCVLAYQADF